MKVSSIPVLPLRDIVVFPHMVAPLFVGRTLSINALKSIIFQEIVDWEMAAGAKMCWKCLEMNVSDSVGTLSKDELQTLRNKKVVTF